MEKPQRKVRVSRTTNQRSPKSVRRLGRALIALAQAQLEAEAQAAAEAAPSDRQPEARRTGGEDHDATGDAA